MLSCWFPEMDIANAVFTMSYTVLMVTWCCQNLTSKSLAAPLYVCYCFIWFEGSCCKQNIGTLSWLNMITLQRAPTPIFVKLVRCLAHGCSFARLRYSHKTFELTGWIYFKKMALRLVIVCFKYFSWNKMLPGKYESAFCVKTVTSG